MAGAQHESTPVPFSDAPTAKTGSQHESTDPLLRSMSSCLHRRLLAEDCSTKKLEDPRPLIPKVPAHIRETDSKAYSPQFISIGPYHHDHPRLYSESTDDHMESDRFVEMMVLDGCFILEFLIKFYTRNREDPIFSVPWMLPLIRRDLLKLENQIPFFLLQRLFDLVRKPPTADGNPFPTLPEIAYIYLAFKRCPDVKSLSGTQIDHLLHLYDWTLLPPSGSPVICNDPKSSWFTRSLSLLHLSTSNSQIEKAKHSAATIPSASELRKAGVKFRRQSKEAESPLDINFKGNVLEVPQLSVVDGTNPPLPLNLPEMWMESEADSAMGLPEVVGGHCHGDDDERSKGNWKLGMDGLILGKGRGGLPQTGFGSLQFPMGAIMNNGQKLDWCRCFGLGCCHKQWSPESL